MKTSCDLPFEAQALKRPPLRYHGGKWKIAPWVISHFPDHRTYVEVFGGGAGVMLHKPQSTIEVYNDLEGQVVNFFRVIRNQAQLIGFRLHQSKCRMASEAYGKHWTSVCVISSANWVLGIWPFFRYVHA